MPRKIRRPLWLFAVTSLALTITPWFWLDSLEVLGMGGALVWLSYAQWHFS